MTTTFLDAVAFEKFESYRTGTIVFVFEIERVRAGFVARFINPQKRNRSQRKCSFTLIACLFRQTIEILLAYRGLIESLLAYIKHHRLTYVGFERSTVRIRRTAGIGTGGTSCALLRNLVRA
jgi:hypothetical protein